MHTDSTKERDQPLKDSETGFGHVVECSPDGILITDSDGRILYVNTALEKMTGRGKAQLIGRDFGHPVLSEQITEIEMLSATGGCRVAEMRVVATDWQGQPAMLATIRDISERVRLTENLKRSNADLENFARILSHDFRAPLRNLKLLSAWLQEDHSSSLNADASEDLDMIRRTASRMARMTEDLLQYSLVSARQSINRNVCLDDVLEEALDNIADLRFGSEAQITSDPLPSIDCNVRQIVSLVENILSNGITCCAIKPKIAIASRVKDGQLHLNFSDNGIGVEKQYWEAIFEPFNQLLPEEGREGSGIGLATCKRIVELHEGRIWFESKPGVGSVVHVTLPMKHRLSESSRNTTTQADTVATTRTLDAEPVGHLRELQP